MNKQQDVSSDKVMMEEIINEEALNDNEFDELLDKNIPLNFQFKKLNKKINWDRIKGLNLDRIINKTDVATLMTVVDDISKGDISQKDIDPNFEKSIILAQLSAQYLLSCENLLHNRTKIIKKAINTFDNEEEELNFQISKYKAREKALRREKKSLDDLHSQYTEIISSIDLKLEKKISKKLNQSGKKVLLTRREEYELEKSIRLKYSSFNKNSNNNNNDNDNIQSKSNHNNKGKSEEKICQDKNSNNNNKEKYGKIIKSIPSSKNSWQNQDSNRFTQGNKDNKSKINTEDVENFDSYNELNSSSSYNKSYENIPTLDTNKSDSKNKTNSINENFKKSEIKKSTWSTGNISEPNPIYDDNEAKSSNNTDIVVGNNADSTSVRGSIALNSTGMMSVDSLNFADSLKNHLNDDDNDDNHHDKDVIKPTYKSASPSPPHITTTSLGNTVVSDGVASLSNNSNIDKNKPLVNNAIKLNKDEVELEDFEDFSFNDSIRDDTMNSQNKSVIIDINIPANILKEYKNSSSKYVSGDDDDDDDEESGYFIKLKKESIMKKKGHMKNMEEHDDIFQRMSPDGKNNDGIFSIKKQHKHFEVNSIDISTADNGIDGILNGIHQNNSIKSQHSLYLRDDEKSEDGPVFGISKKSKSNTSLKSINNEYDDEYAMSETANEFLAQHMGNSPDDKKKQILHSNDMRKGVLNYLYNPRDEDENIDFAVTNNMNRNNRDNNDEDDVLIGTTKLTTTLGKTLGDTNSTFQSDISDGLDGFNLNDDKNNEDSNEDLDEKMNKILMKKSMNLSEEDENNIHEDDDNDEYRYSFDDDSQESSQLSIPIIVEKPTVLVTSAVELKTFWTNGRAPLELVEVAQALDVFISSIKFDSKSVSLSKNIKVAVEIMGISSKSSPNFLSSSGVKQVNYATHIRFNRDLSGQLSDEISDEGENFAMFINIMSEDDATIIGQATVFLYVMIEESCSILRQEVEIISSKDNNVIMGLAVVDVRGHQLLKRCS